MMLEIDLSDASPNDALRSLGNELLDRIDELRGRVEFREAEPGPGAMGSTVQMLLVDATNPVVISALVTLAVAWLHEKRSVFLLRIRRGGTTTTLAAMTSGEEVKKAIETLIQSAAAEPSRSDDDSH
jgi:hypothetical protein